MGSEYPSCLASREFWTTSLTNFGMGASLKCALDGSGHVVYAAVAGGEVPNRIGYCGLCHSPFLLADSKATTYLGYSNYRVHSMRRRFYFRRMNHAARQRDDRQRRRYGEEVREYRHAGFY